MYFSEVDFESSIKACFMSSGFITALPITLSSTFCCITFLATILSAACVVLYGAVFRAAWALRGKLHKTLHHVTEALIKSFYRYIGF